MGSMEKKKLPTCARAGGLRNKPAKGKQIGRTQAESQWIVALGYSQHLQYLDAIKSSAKDLSLAIFEIEIGHRAFSGGGAHTKLAEAIAFHVILQVVDNRA